jgi:hypothetical protein
MLAWVMNMGFAASDNTVEAVAPGRHDTLIVLGACIPFLVMVCLSI